jgi:serine/threonine protein kinase
VSDFSKGDKLGEGTYGSVYTAIDKASGQRVALKRVKLTGEGFEREGMPLTSLREISLLRQLQHPNIISLLDVVVGSRADSVFLVFEFCAFDLARVIDTMGKPFAHGEVKWMMSELVHAVEYIHANLVIHRDIKMSNILLAADGTLKLTIEVAYGHAWRNAARKRATETHISLEAIAGRKGSRQLK